MNKLFIIISFLFGLVFADAYGQPYSETQIDSLLNKIRFFGDSIPVAALAQSRQYYDYAASIGYQKGMVASTLLMSKNLFNTHQYDTALAQNLKVEEVALRVNDYELLSEIYRLNGLNYNSIGLFGQATLAFEKGLRFASLISDHDVALRQKGLLYTDIAMGYHRRGDDLAVVLKYLLQSKDCFSKIKDSKSRIVNLSLSHVNIGYCFLDMKQYQKATLHLNKALELVDQQNFNTVRLYAYLDLGRVNTEQNHLEEGIAYFEKSMVLAKSIKNYETLCDTYLYLFKTYKKSKDLEKEEYYYNKYISLHDSLQTTQKRATLQAAKALIGKKDATNQQRTTLWLYGLCFIGFVTLFIVFRALRIYFRKNKEKEEINQKRLRLEKKTALLSKATAGNDKALIEVIELAKNNDEQFLVAFRKSHSDFYERFTERFPDLNEGELKVCAFLKLGFYVKDIAIYTDVTVRSVESRIYRIRKKTQLSIKDDLSLWIISF